MKVKLLTLLYFVSLSLEGGGHLIDQLYSIQGEVWALPQDLTIENIDNILAQIEVLVRSDKNPTEEEDAAIIELNTDSMFLKVLRDYMEDPTRRDLAGGLEDWAECKPGFYNFLQQAIEKNPENEALKNIDLNFPTWWTGYALPQTE